MHPTAWIYSSTLATAINSPTVSLRVQQNFSADRKQSALISRCTLEQLLLATGARSNCPENNFKLHDDTHCSLSAARNYRHANKFVLLKLFCQDTNAKPTREIAPENRGNRRQFTMLSFLVLIRCSRHCEITQARNTRAARNYQWKYNYTKA